MRYHFFWLSSQKFRQHLKGKWKKEADSVVQLAAQRGGDDQKVRCIAESSSTRSSPPTNSSISVCVFGFFHRRFTSIAHQPWPLDANS